MGKLADHRKERLAAALAAGHKLADAAGKAGYTADRRNAHRTARQPAVRARIEELRAIIETKRAATIAAAPAPPDREPTGNEIADAALAEYDRARSVGDHRAARSALSIAQRALSVRERKRLAVAAEAAAATVPAKGCPSMPVEELNKLLRQNLMTQHERIVENLQAVKDAHQHARAQAWSERTMSEYRERCAAWQARADTPEGRAGVIASKRRGEPTIQ
jgi:hypothetical protein